jgi:hypothetical protein
MRNLARLLLDAIPYFTVMLPYTRTVYAAVLYGHTYGFKTVHGSAVNSAVLFAILANSTGTVTEQPSHMVTADIPRLINAQTHVIVMQSDRVLIPKTKI